MSIAWAVIEYIHNHIGAKTLFATHYHELTQLEGKLQRVKNYCISVREKDNNIIFLRKIIKGGADRSYGIHVASLAGLPKKVIKRAGEIMESLKNVETAASSNVSDRISINNNPKQDKTVKNKQLELYNYVEQNVLNEIKALDIMTMSPIEALNFLYKIKKKIDNIEG